MPAEDLSVAAAAPEAGPGVPRPAAPALENASTSAMKEAELWREVPPRMTRMVAPGVVLNLCTVAASSQVTPPTTKMTTVPAGPAPSALPAAG